MYVLAAQCSLWFTPASTGAKSVMALAVIGRMLKRMGLPPVVRSLSSFHLRCVVLLFFKVQILAVCAIMTFSQNSTINTNTNTPPPPYRHRQFASADELDEEDEFHVAPLTAERHPHLVLPPRLYSQENPELQQQPPPLVYPAPPAGFSQSEQDFLARLGVLASGSLTNFAEAAATSSDSGNSSASTPAGDVFDPPEFTRPTTEPNVSFLQGVYAKIKSLGISALTYGIRLVLSPVITWLSSTLGPVLKYISENVTIMICTFVMLVISFFLGWMGTHSMIGGLLSAIVSGATFYHSSKISNRIDLACKLLVELLDSFDNEAIDVLHNDTPASFASKTWTLFKGFTSSMGFHMIYCADSIHKSWMRVKSIQDFGAFIFEILPTFAQEVIYQYCPTKAVMMLYRSCGWQPFSEELSSLVKHLQQDYDPAVVAQYTVASKNAARYLQAHMATPWYRTAASDLAKQNAAFQSLRQKLTAHKGMRPFMIQVGGLHNLGKTEICKIICDLCGSLALKRKVCACYYSRGADQFVDGLTDQPVVYYKDILGHSADSCTMDVDEWCCFYDGSFAPKYSAVERKDTQVEVAAVIGATNFLHPHTVRDQTNLKSYLRKRDLTIEAFPAPDFARFYGTPQWEPLLSNLSSEDKSSFAAFNYRFLHPVDPGCTDKIPGIPFHYRSPMSAKDLLVSIKHMFTHHRVKRMEDTRDFQMLLNDVISDLPTEIVEVPTEQAETDAKAKNFDIMWKSLAILGPLIALGSLVTLLLRSSSKKKKEEDDSFVKLHSVPASHARGKVAKDAHFTRTTGRETISALHGDSNQYIPQLEKAQKQVVALHDKTGKRFGWGFMITNQTLLTNSHGFRVADKFIERSFMMHTGTNEQFPQVVEPHEIFANTYMNGDKHYVSDMAVIKLKLPIRGMKDLSHMLTDELADPRFVYRVQCDKIQYIQASSRSRQHVTVNSTDPTWQRVLFPQPFRYNLVSTEGDCGAPIFFEWAGRLTFGGIHGGFLIPNTSYAAPLLKADFKGTHVALHTHEQVACLHTLDLGGKAPVPPGVNNLLIGTFSRPIVTPMKTKLKRTVFPLSGLVGISVKSPQILLIREARFGRISPWPVRDSIHEYATQVVDDLFSRLIDNWHGQRTCLTSQQAVEQLDPSTSVGYPWVQMNKKRLDLTPLDASWDPEFKKAFNYLEDTCAAGEYPACLIVPCLKDETLPMAKVEINKTRTFEISPYEATLFGKKYWGPFIDYISANPGRLPTTIGLDVNCSDYHNIMKGLEDFSPYFVDFDYEAFETINNSRKAEGMMRSADRFYTDGHSHERRAYLMMMFQRYMGCGRACWQLWNSRPSGDLTCCHGNSCTNTYELACAYKMINPSALVSDFNRDFRHFTCGDDVVGAIHPDVIGTFNAVTIQAAMASIGITITPGTKTASMQPYISRTQVTYLKTLPLYSPTFKGIVAYVPDAALESQLDYCRSDEAEGQRNLALSILKTASMHGEVLGSEMPAGDRTYPQWVDYVRRFIPDIEAPSMSSVLHDYYRYNIASVPDMLILNDDDFIEVDDNEFHAMDLQLHMDLSFDCDCVAHAPSADFQRCEYYCYAEAVDFESEAIFDIWHLDATVAQCCRPAHHEGKHRVYCDSNDPEFQQTVICGSENTLPRQPGFAQVRNIFMFGATREQGYILHARHTPEGSFLTQVLDASSPPTTPDLVQNYLPILVQQELQAEPIPHFELNTDEIHPMAYNNAHDIWTADQDDALRRIFAGANVTLQQFFTDDEYELRPAVDREEVAAEVFAAAQSETTDWVRTASVEQQIATESTLNFLELFEDIEELPLLSLAHPDSFLPHLSHVPIMPMSSLISELRLQDYEEGEDEENQGPHIEWADANLQLHMGNTQTTYQMTTGNNNNVGAKSDATNTTDVSAAYGGGMKEKLMGGMSAGANWLSTMASSTIRYVDSRRRQPGAMGPMPADAGEVLPPQGSTDQPNHTFTALPIDQPTLVRTTLNGVDTANNLGDLAACTEKITPGTFMSVIDEMSKDFYTNHFTYFNTETIAYETGGQTFITSFPMHPFQIMSNLTLHQGSGTTGAFSLPRLEQWAVEHMYNRGSIIIKVHFAAPSKTVARFGFCYSYADNGPAPHYEQAVTGPTIIHDFDPDHRELFIEIPYISAHEWLVPPMRDTDLAIDGGTGEYSSCGQLRVYLCTAMSSDVTDYTNSPQLHFYISGGRDFESKRAVGFPGLAPFSQFRTDFDTTESEFTTESLALHTAQGTTVNAPARALVIPGKRNTNKLVPILLDKFAEKPVTIDLLHYTASMQPTPTYAYPGDLLKAQALYAQSAMRFWSADAIITAYPQGTGTIGQHLVMYWAPYTTPGQYVDDPINCTNLDYVIIDLASNQPVQLVIPFRYHREFFTVGSNERYGYIGIQPLGALQAPSAGTSSVDVEIQVSWRNFKSFVPAEIAESFTAVPLALHMADEAKAVTVDTAITSAENKTVAPVTAIAGLQYQPDERMINHFSDHLKRPILVESFNFNNSAGLTKLIDETQYWINIPQTNIVASYAAWSGDRNIQISAADPNNTQDTFQMAYVPTLNNVTPFTPTDYSNLLGRPVTAGLNNTRIVNEVPGNLAARDTYGYPPVATTNSLRNRVNLPYQTPNKFLLTNTLGSIAMSLPPIDLTNQAQLLVAVAPNQGSSSPTYNVHFQFGDGFRLGHYRPVVYNQSGTQREGTGFAYNNYPGVYTNLAA